MDPIVESTVVDAVIEELTPVEDLSMEVDTPAEDLSSVEEATVSFINHFSVLIIRSPRKSLFLNSRQQVP